MSVIKYVSDTMYNAVIGMPSGIIDVGFNVAQTVWGVAGTVFSVISLGKNDAINKWADNTSIASNILPNLYSPIVRVINPEASLDDPRAGIITTVIARPIFGIAARASCGQGLFLRHIMSRVSYAVAAAASVASRIADLALGVIGAAVAIFPCFGRSTAVNHFAVRHLTTFGVVHDVCYGLRGFINPQQFVFARRFV